MNQCRYSKLTKKFHCDSKACDYFDKCEGEYCYNYRAIADAWGKPGGWEFVKEWLKGAKK